MQQLKEQFKWTINQNKYQAKVPIQGNGSDKEVCEEKDVLNSWRPTTSTLGFRQIEYKVKLLFRLSGWSKGFQGFNRLFVCLK